MNNFVYFLLLFLIIFSCGKTGKVEFEKHFVNKSNENNLLKDSSRVYADPFEIPCFKLPENVKIKPVFVSKHYIGLVIFKAKYNKTTLRFTSYEIIATRLKYRKSGKPFYPSKKELEKIIPRLIKSLENISLQRINQNGCINPVYFGLTVQLE